MIHRLRIALAQINVTVGDLDGNKQKVLHYLDRARALGVDLIAFPELLPPPFEGQLFLEAQH